MTLRNQALAFFNTLTRKKEAFKPLEASKVKIYTCRSNGFNDYAHIGIFELFCLRIA